MDKPFNAYICAFSTASLSSIFHKNKILPWPF